MKIFLLSTICALLIGRAFSQDTLISQTDIGLNWYSGHFAYGGQSFTLSQEVTLNGFRFYTHQPEGVTQISLRVGEDTTSTPLYTTSIDITTGGWISVPIPSVALCPGLYCFTISEFQWGASNLSNPYPGGDMLYVGGWGSGDMAFEIIGTIDTIVPVPDNMTLPDVVSNCPVYELAAPTATDNCTLAVTVTNDAVFPIENDTIVVTWTYNDGHGGITTQLQNVLVADTEGPEPDEAVLPDFTITCQAAELPEPAVTDCSGEVTFHHDATLPITAVGTTVVTWTYTDSYGNTTTQTQNIVIAPVNTAVTQISSTLTSSEPGAAYQWLDCDNNSEPIAGATSQSFTMPGITGNYAVRVAKNNCVDTSECLAIDVTGISEAAVMELTIYPNPANSRIFVQSAELKHAELSILDMQGRTVLQQQATGALTEISIECFEKGIYLVQISTENGFTASERIIKN